MQPQWCSVLPLKVFPSCLLPAGMPEGAMQVQGEADVKSPTQLWSLHVTLLTGQASVPGAIVATLLRGT